MSPGEVSQVITAVASVGAVLVSLYNAVRIQQVHKATNSMKDELVAVTRKDALAEGLKQGRDENT